MNIDNLHDALGLLDDELIEEVEVLRNERKVEAERRSKKWIVSWTYVAAGLLLCLVSVYVVGGLFSKGFSGNKKTDTATGVVEESTSAETENKGNADDKDHFEEVTDGGGTSENTSTGTGESVTNAREIKVEVTELINAGFVGVIKESADTETYTVGTELTVVLMEDKWLVEGDATQVQHKDYVTDDVAFPVGSIVIVRFMPQENTQANNGAGSKNTEYIIYADEITFE